MISGSDRQGFRKPALAMTTEDPVLTGDRGLVGLQWRNKCNRSLRSFRSLAGYPIAKDGATRTTTRKRSQEGCNYRRRDLISGSYICGNRFKLAGVQVKSSYGFEFAGVQTAPR